ncbi:MAG: hypothetical protein AB1847_06655 [bacterium]
MILAEQELQQDLPRQCMQKDEPWGLHQRSHQELEQSLRHGVQQGLQEAVVDILESRFDHVPLPLKKRLTGIADQAVLESLLQKAVTIDTLAELEEYIFDYIT